MQSGNFHFSDILTANGWRRDVTVHVGPDGNIQELQNGYGSNAKRIRGIAVPAMPNVHSHAHQRLMVGLAERSGPGADSFWTWRELMYGFSSQLQPDDLEAVAAQLYLEMLQAGFSAVGEFQYLHHQPDGTAYANPAEMSLRCLAAASTVGLGITILPTLYAYSGFGGQAPLATQRRFITDADQFLGIVDSLSIQVKSQPLQQLGIAPHSLRAVTPALLREVLSAIPATAPVHIHVAEQLKEVSDSIAFSGLRPVEFLLREFALSDRWTVIHATHMTPAETEVLARSGAISGLCPTTEANLGDGVFPATAYLSAGGRFAIGSDSHISVSPAEDLRMLEYSQRLRDFTRNALAGGPSRSTGRNLYGLALEGGARSLNQPIGAIAQGRRCDIAVLDEDHPLLVGRSQDQAIDSWIFSGGTQLVKDMIVAGRHLLKDRRHLLEDEIAHRFRAVVERLAP